MLNKLGVATGWNAVLNPGVTETFEFSRKALGTLSTYLGRLTSIEQLA